MRCTVICLIILLSTSVAVAERGVYLYNMTGQDISIAVENDLRHLKSKYWRVGVQTVPKYTGQKILSYNRHRGIKNRRTYGFKITATGHGTKPLVMRVNVRGKVVRSRTRQGIDGQRLYPDSTRWRSAAWPGSDLTVRYGMFRSMYKRVNGWQRNTVFVISEPSKPIFRLPIENTKAIYTGRRPLLKASKTPDMRPGRQSNSLRCLDYKGRKGARYCYGGHRGSDYILRGGFNAMDKSENWIVAARAGRVIFVRDHLYDRCRYVGRKSLKKPYCKNRNVIDGRPLQPNKIVIDHGDGIHSSYLHLKTDSSRVKAGDWVRCGQRIAEIGSSGKSMFPHLHFAAYEQARSAYAKCEDGKRCTHVVWGTVVNPYEGKFTGRGYWVRQGRSNIPQTTCAIDQPRPENVVFAGPKERESEPTPPAAPATKVLPVKMKLRPLNKQILKLKVK